ncbi:uncharacterized protein BCR38DRAFT_526858 [Pseudomassariella vexata]|uniref:Zn(2)-C6 fungal-type domain-containing protein n=1 Tax=Pseudomassariella vexata TaxID=1141098 RepID=A0A1Y2DLD4_9PEZI|nr:uncharacterized protein BCR38DRAFT_526858 [Pseudomassariella vexata]ORY59535.1 hypothetical protein BCR38DRAFT_526858 [Pseudomassariella vexata]
MVYTGKSTSCHTCRIRRVKCDEMRPHCLKCRRSGRECNGYRDDSGIIIQDMTSATINKWETLKDASYASKSEDPSHNQAHTSNRGRHRAHSEGRENRDDPNISDKDTKNVTRWPSTLPTAHVLLPPVEDQALHYLLSRYAQAPSQLLDPGYIPVLKLLKRRKNMSHCLATSLSATSLAVYSTRKNSRMAILRARAAYSKALKLINNAVQVPGSCHDDELLASIVVLVLFEIICSDNFDGFSSHAYGAAAMIGARGKRPFRDKLGQALFGVVCNNAVILKLMGLSTPHAGTEAWLQWLNDPRYLLYIAPDPSKDEDNDQSETVPTQDTIDMDEATNTRGDAAINTAVTGRTGTFVIPHLPSRPIGLNGSTSKLATAGGNPDLVKIFQETKAVIQAGSRYHLAEASEHIESTKLLSDCSLHKPCGHLLPAGKVHLYKSLAAANLHVAGCVARVFTCNAMARCAANLHIQDSDEYKEAILIGRREVSDLIGSIPYFCGLVGHASISKGGKAANTHSLSSITDAPAALDHSEDHVSTASVHSSQHSKEPIVAASFQACSILFPMGAAATSEFITEEEFGYICCMFTCVANNFGLRIAEGLRKFSLDQRKSSGMHFWK